MEYESAKKFTDACKAANIKTYSFDTDLGTHYYNNEDNARIVLDQDMCWNFSSSDAYAGATPQFGHDRIMVMGSQYGDIHEVRCAGTLEQIKTLISSLGIEASNDDMKIIAQINGSDYPLIPPTNDYTFRLLTEEEQAKLSEDDKKKYKNKVDSLSEDAKVKLQEDFDVRTGKKLPRGSAIMSNY